MKLANVIREIVGPRNKPLKKYEYDSASAWYDLDDFKRARALGIPGIPDPRCFTLQSCMRAVSDVPGDVAECGVRFGKSARFMLETDRSLRRYHLFDSFEGVSTPAIEDHLPDSNTSYWKKGDIYAPEKIARENLSGFSNVNFYPGWIPTRFNETENCTFALAHIDVDLYQPTLDSIEFFWPRLAQRGILVCDDYGSRKCPGARKALDQFFKLRKDSMLIELPSCQALVIKF